MELKHIYFDIDEPHWKKLNKYLTSDNKLYVECDDFVEIIIDKHDDFGIHVLDFIKFYNFLLMHDIKCYIAHCYEFFNKLPYTNDVELIEYLFDIDFTCFSPDDRFQY